MKDYVKAFDILLNKMKNGEMNFDEKTANRSGCFSANVLGVISPKISNKMVTISVIVGMMIAKFVTLN